MERGKKFYAYTNPSFLSNLDMRAGPISAYRDTGKASKMSQMCGEELKIGGHKETGCASSNPEGPVHHCSSLI